MRLCIGNVLHHLHPSTHPPENSVLVVQPGRGDDRDKELAPVGVGAGVGHGEDSGSGVLQGEVLVLELCAIDGLAAGAVVRREVTALGQID